MDVEIIEKGKHNLYVYDDDILLFYSKVKYHIFKHNRISIFTGNDERVLEVGTFSRFTLSRYKILYQDKNIKHIITKIKDGKIYFGQAEILTRKKENIFSLNINASYFLTQDIEIGKVKQKMWNYPQKMHLKIENKNIQYLDMIILHILTTRTEQFGS